MTVSKTANDKNGSSLCIGDEITCRAIVTDVSDGHVLTTTVEFPHKELWFQGNLVERTVQGAASKDADRRVGVGGAAPAAPASVPIAIAEPSDGGTVATAVAEPAELSPREIAILFAMSKGYTREAAEKVVEEHGTRYILADKAEEEAEANKTLAGGNGAAANPTSPNEQAKPPAGGTSA